MRRNRNNSSCTLLSLLTKQGVHCTILNSRLGITAKTLTTKYDINYQLFVILRLIFPQYHNSPKGLHSFLMTMKSAVKNVQRFALTPSTVW